MVVLGRHALATPPPVARAFMSRPAAVEGAPDGAAAEEPGRNAGDSWYSADDR